VGPPPFTEHAKLKVPVTVKILLLVLCKGIFFVSLKKNLKMYADGLPHSNIKGLYHQKRLKA
jgi:hypothetical protein